MRYSVSLIFALFVIFGGVFLRDASAQTASEVNESYCEETADALYEVAKLDVDEIQQGWTYKVGSYAVTTAIASGTVYLIVKNGALRGELSQFMARKTIKVILGKLDSPVLVWIKTRKIRNAYEECKRKARNEESFNPIEFMLTKAAS